MNDSVPFLALTGDVTNSFRQQVEFGDRMDAAAPMAVVAAGS